MPPLPTSHHQSGCDKVGRALLVEARALAEEALQISDHCVAEADLPAAESRRLLGRLCLADNQLLEAAAHLSHACELLGLIHGFESLPVAEVMEDLAWARLRLHYQDHGFRRGRSPPPLPVRASSTSEEGGSGGEGGGGGSGEAGGEAGSAVDIVGGEAVGGGSGGGGDASPRKVRVLHDATGDRVAVATDAGGARKRASIEEEAGGDGDGDSEDEEEGGAEDEAAGGDASTDAGVAGALQLLTRAKTIRAAKQGCDHPALARCLMKLADYFWLVDRYDKALSAYEEAMRIFALVNGERSKEVVMVCNWSVHALILLGNMPEAAKANERGRALCKAVFGDLSYELWRCMTDKVYLIQRSVGPDASATSTEARKAFSLAERIETHATILYGNLQAEKVEDDRVSELSIFAPLKRELVLRPEVDGADGETGRRRRSQRKDKQVSGSRANLLKKQGSSSKGVAKSKVARGGSSSAVVGGG